MTGAKAVSSGYAAPEQYRGGTDARSDVYSLGATLYALLIGGDPPDAQARERGIAILAPPRAVNASITAQTEQAIVRAMTVTPQTRFASTSELKQALTVQVKPPPPPPPPKPNFNLANWIGMSVIVILVFALGAIVVNRIETPTPMPMATPVPATQAPTRAVISSATIVPVPTVMPLSSATPMPRVGDTRAFAPDNAPMMFVPAGDFTMGSEDFDNEEPIHTVYLDAFWMDKFEVTNALYKKCVDAGKCTRPNQTSSSTRGSYYGDASFDNYPVIYVDWNQAKMYCEWVGKRLPTEAEWEKAARGTDGRVYSWGNTFDASKLNSAEGNKGDTTQVGAYSSGASPYGIMDLSGNVWEWVADWYGENYYMSSPRNNPTGPSSGSARVLRGGSWDFGLQSSRTANRVRDTVSNSGDDVGFRCARGQ
jgi:formylglycine-generating enzyme required for sulfatase activity